MAATTKKQGRNSKTNADYILWKIMSGMIFSKILIVKTTRKNIKKESRTLNITTYASQKRASRSLHRKRNKIVAMIHGHPREKKKNSTMMKEAMEDSIDKKEDWKFYVLS